MEIKRSDGAFLYLWRLLSRYWALLLSAKSFMKAVIIFSVSLSLHGRHIISPTVALRFRKQKSRMRGIMRAIGTQSLFCEPKLETPVDFFLGFQKFLCLAGPSKKWQSSQPSSVPRTSTSPFLIRMLRCNFFLSFTIMTMSSFGAGDTELKDNIRTSVYVYYIRYTYCQIVYQFKILYSQ